MLRLLKSYLCEKLKSLFFQGGVFWKASSLLAETWMETKAQFIWISWNINNALNTPLY